jgi:hypothetical protein
METDPVSEKLYSFLFFRIQDERQSPKPGDSDKIEYYVDTAGLPHEFISGSRNFRWIIQET